MEESANRFHKWESNFIKTIQSKRLISREDELEFKNFIRNIENTNSLPSPYEKLTNYFLNVFSPQIINLILDIRSLSDEIVINYEIILRQYSQILGQQLTINTNIINVTESDDPNSNEKFIEAASKIIELNKSNFYLISEKSKTTSIKSSENYDNNCYAFATTSNLELFISFFQSPTMKSLSKTEKIVKILFPVSHLFDSEHLNVLIQIISSKIWELISDQNPRKLDISEIETALISLEKMASSKTVKFVVWKIQIDFSIKILKSGILTNQLSSLSTICRICKESPELISPILRDENLIDYLLNPDKNSNNNNNNNNSNESIQKTNQTSEKVQHQNDNIKKENFENDKFKNDNENEDNSNNNQIEIDDNKNSVTSSSTNFVKLKRKQSFIGDDIHFELVNYIADIFSTMYVCKCATDSQLKTLWLKSISQSQTTIGTFLKSMQKVLSQIPKEPFFNMIIETNRYPDSILPFLQSIASQCPNQCKILIFNQLHDLYFQQESQHEETESVLIQTMLNYIPQTDQTFCDKLQEECIGYIKSDKNSKYSLKVLQNALFSMSSEKAHKAFEIIIEKVDNESIHFLDLLAEILKKFDSQINQNDFNLLQEKVTQMIPDHSKSVCQFYQKLIDSKSSKNVFSNETVLSIYNHFCSLPYDEDVFEMIKMLYRFLSKSSPIENSESSIEIVDSIWSHLFETNRKEVSTFLISIYTNLKDHNKAEKFIGNCLKKLNCVGSLEAIKSIIHVMEDGTNSNEDNQQNRMIFSFDLFTINLLYNKNKPRQIKVTKDICYEGFKRKVIEILHLGPNSNSKNKSLKKNFNVLLYDNSKLLNHDNFNLYDNINVSVHVDENLTKDIIDYNIDKDDVLPSQVLLQEKYFSPIYDILIENNQELSPIALNILNLIPTLPTQISEINSIISSYSTDENSSKKALETFLSADKPYLLDYRIHIIGSIKFKESRSVDDDEGESLFHSINCRGFLDCFYKSDGIEILLSIIFNIVSLSIPNNRCINDLLRVTKCLLLNDTYHDNIINSIEKVKDNIGTFLQWTKDVSNSNNDSLLSDITLFMKELTNYLVNFDDFSEIVNLTIIHKQPEVRSNIYDVVNSIESIEIKEKLIIPLLPNLAKISKCSEYFNLLTNIAERTKNAFNLYESVIQALYKNFTMPKNVPPLEILMFDQPPANYAYGIFKTMNILIERLIDEKEEKLKFEDAEKLFKFLTNEVIFNPYKYYQPSTELFTAYLNLLDKFGTFIEFLEPVVKVIEDFKLSIKTNSALSPTARNRGIKNLGATCYMNSTIQQLYNIGEFTARILSTNADELNNQNNQQQQEESQANENAKNKANEDKAGENQANENAENKANEEKTGENQANENAGNKDNEGKANENQENQNVENKTNEDKTGESEANENAENKASKDKISENKLSQPKPLPKATKDWFSELQYDFAKLWLFPSTSINISNFVQCWKGYDGEPTNPHQQQDSAEFLQLLIDRLEEKIPGITSIFKGKIEHCTIGAKVQYERKNYETFVIFPLEVENHTKTSESFRTFLQPDRFECNDEELGKFDALRYHQIVEAPKILIIQLKRFNYNLSTNEREKINSFYTFSHELDLSSIMKKGQKSAIYDLCGIVQHTGNANSGHYFSDVQRENGKWLCLNDNKCTKVNGDDLPFEAAGGKEEKTVYNDKTKSYQKVTVDKTTNAYLLFYRLREKEQEQEEDGKQNDKHFELNEKTMNRILPAIQKAIFEAVCSTSQFYNLVLKICQNSENDEFLFKYTLNALRVTKNQVIQETLISRCISICNTNESYCDFILNRETDFYEFIVLMKLTLNRKYYLSIIEAALQNCSDETRKKFYQYLFNQISSSSQIIYENRACIPEFFKIVSLTVNNYAIEKVELLNALLNFVVDSIQLYDSKHKSEKIFNCVNLSNAFDLMTNLLKEIEKDQQNDIEKVKLSIASKMFKGQFLTSLTISQIHCNVLSSLLEFVLISNSQTKKLFHSYLEKVTKTLPIPSIALFLNLSMTISDQELIDLFFKIITSKNSTEIVLFFHSLEPICHQNRNIFMFNAQLWINPFLLSSNINMRASLVIFIYKMFADVVENKGDMNEIENAKGVIVNIYQNLIDSVPLLIQKITKLKRVSQTTQIADENIPTQEFFEILTWSVEVTKMKDQKDIQIFVPLLQQLDELLRNVANVNSSVSQFHCLQYLVKLYGKQLFKAAQPTSIITPLNNSCKTTVASANNNGNHVDVLSLINGLLIEVLPTNCVCYLKSKLFAFLLTNNFDEKCSKFVDENLNKETVRLITTVLWNQTVLRTNCNLIKCNVLYLKTSWKIIKEYNEMCDIIYDQQDFLVLLNLINKNSAVQRAAAKFLGEFNFAYAAVNKNKKFFLTLKTQTLYNKYKENGFKWSLVYESIYNNRQMISPGNGGLCHFLRSMIVLKTNPPQSLLSLISKSPKSFVMTVLPTVPAVELVCDLCVAFPDSGEAINCLIREFSSIKKCYKVVEIFCQAFAKMKRKNFWMDLQKPLKEIFLNSDEIEVAGETVLRMSEQLFDKETLLNFRRKVLELMAEEIKKTLDDLDQCGLKMISNEYRKLENGYEFIRDITSTIGDRMPGIEISKEDSQKLIEIFKSHRIMKASDPLFYYISKK